MSKKALLLENIHADAVAILEDVGFTVEVLAVSLGEDDLIKRLDGV